MSKCIILGAGASLGYSDNLKDLDRPPKTDCLFKNGFELGIFTQAQYPKLYENLKLYQKTILEWSNEDPKREFNVEKFLAWLVEQFEFIAQSSRTSFPSKDSSEKLHSYQKALGESWFYLFEIIRYYCLSYKHGSNNYEKLARFCMTNHYSVISLNYDTLIEQAILACDGDFDYSCSRSDAVSVAKIHGSINWINPATGGMGFGGVSEDKVFEVITTHIFSNKIQISNPQIRRPNEMTQITTNKLLRSGTDYDIPILIPPLGQYKVYGDSQFLNYMKGRAQVILENLEELIIIGTTLRPEDDFLCDLVKNSVKENTKVVIVGNIVEIKKRLNDILGWDVIPTESYSKFSEYANKLTA